MWRHDPSFESGVDDGGTGKRKQCTAHLQEGPEARPSHSPNSFVLILAKNYDENARRADRDTHAIHCNPADASVLQMQTARTVEPSGSSTLSLPAVKHAPASMEGGGGIGPALPQVTRQTTHEMSQNVFKSLLNSKDHAVTPGYSLTASPGAAARRIGTSTGPRTLGVVVQVVVRRRMQAVAPVFHTEPLYFLVEFHGSFPAFSTGIGLDYFSISK